MSNCLNHKSGLSGLYNGARMGSSSGSLASHDSATGTLVVLLFVISSLLDKSLSLTLLTNHIGGHIKFWESLFVDSVRCDRLGKNFRRLT